LFVFAAQDVSKNRINRFAMAKKQTASRAQRLVMKLLEIPGTSGQEAGVAKFIHQELLKAGANEKDIAVDSAHRRTVIKGDSGNLAFKLRGTRRAPRRMLMAHMDTVPICVGCQPVRKGSIVRSADPNTGLGADDRAGCAVVLYTATEMLRRGGPHPPLTFLWPVQEEVGLQGARHVRLSALGKPKLAFNWDGGAADKLTIGATGGYRLGIDVRGRASHAGGAPEQGVSAIAIASLAIADLHNNGWHGLIIKGRRLGTSNVGIIQGGAATNVVTDRVQIRAEARSHDPVFRREITRQIEKAFRLAAKQVKNSNGKVGEVRFSGQLDYESFKLRDDEPCLLIAEEAVRGIGGEPIRAIANGGLDANWMTRHGIPTVSLGCGQRNQHMVTEELDLKQFDRACKIALRLASGA